MRPLPPKTSVIGAFLWPTSLVFLCSVLIVGYIWVANEYEQLERTTENFKKEFFTHKKNELKSEVQRVRADILRHRTTSLEDHKTRLGLRLDAAMAVIDSLVENDDIKDNRTYFFSRITGALARMQLYQREGELFVYDRLRRQLIFPGQANLDELANNNELIERIEAGAQGFIRYGEQRNTGRALQALIREYGDQSLVIGVTDHLSEYDNKLKTLIFQQLANDRWGADEKGYFFINSYTGDLYLTNGQYFDGQKNIWDLSDTKGKKVVQENSAIARISPNGGYNRYFWRDDDGNEEEKISFVQAIEPWGVFLGTGMNISQLEVVINVRSAEEMARFETRVSAAFGIFISSAIAVLVTLYLIARKLDRNIQIFRTSFGRSTEVREYISVEDVYFDEFKQIATSANRIVNTLDDQTRELEHQVFHDTLTLLPNRLFGFRKLGEMIALCEQDDKCLALFYIDLDNFKQINDSRGHSVGDQMLIAMAERLQDVVVDPTRVARLGGDEFTVISDLLDKPADALNLAQRLLDCFERPFDLDGSQVYGSVSIGVSLYPSDGCDAEVLLRNADSAMYEAKRSGKNAYCLYRSEMTDAVIERQRLSDDLREAIDVGQFELLFQPQWSIAEERIIGAEALVRWHHPEKGVIAPDKFISFAESSGQIKAIGQWVLLEACRKIKEWEDAGCCPDKVAVNISYRQFSHDSIHECIDQALTETGANPSHLELEVTEGSLMRDEWRITDGFSALKAQGVTLSIDDFGTGYSSLSRLKALPIDKLKIDKAFISDIEYDQNDREITRAVIAMGHSLNLTIIAEGVETPAQLAFLKQEACDEVQGYLLSRPVSADELVKQMQTMSLDQNAALSEFASDETS